MDVFELIDPEPPPSPLLVEVPHAGLAIPDEVRTETIVSLDSIQRDADLYVDKLYADAPQAGASLLLARVSRYVVDLNRKPDDIDRETVVDHPAPQSRTQPRGVVWRMTTSGSPSLRQPLTYGRFRARLEQFYSPYHAVLEGRLRHLRERHGFAIVLAAHSMPSTARGVGYASRRADVVPGTLGRTSADARVIDLVDAHFSAAGLSVRHDDPYRGGWTTRHYGRPQDGWHAVQIELNRALYLHEDTLQPKHGDFEHLRALLRELVEKLANLDLGR